MCYNVPMPVLSEHDLTKVRALVKEGLTHAAIAKQFGVDRKAIAYHCRKNGWESDFVKRQRVNRELELEGKKQCATCNGTKPLDEFPKDHRAIGGRSSQCNECRNPKIQEWQKANYSKVLEYGREWKRRNPEHVKQYASRYHKENREKRNASLRSWYQRNPEMRKVYRQQREARERGAKGTFTKEQLIGRIEFYGGRCYLCGCDWYALPKEDQTIDHVIALQFGGTNWPSNLRPACRQCNSIKH